MFYPWTELEQLDKQRPRSAHDRSSQSRLLSLGLLKEEEIWIVGVGVLPFWEARMKMCVQCIHVPQSFVQVETKMQMTSGQGRNQTRTREKGEAKWFLLDSVLVSQGNSLVVLGFSAGLVLVYSVNRL